MSSDSNTAAVLDQFRDPPASVRPMPFFVWNGEVTEGRITEVLEQMAERGCGGVFIHPRPGLITEYLSDRWFVLWKHAVAEAERLGMECHIYDENSYPAGFGGGHVFSSDPRTAAVDLEGQWHLQPGRTSAGRGLPETIAAFAPQADGTWRRVSPGQAVRDASPEAPVLTLDLAPGGLSRFHAGFMYTDLSRPETTRAFLRCTHEQYERHVGQAFGTTIKYAFSDEPSVGGGGSFRLSRWILGEFQREHGYDLLERLDDLCFDTDASPEVRFDYFRTLDRLWIDAFWRPIHDWCGEHDLQFTGHLHESQWPVPAHQPELMRALRYMQAPGNDLLGFQFDPNDRERNLIYQLNLKELASIANQCGRERVLVESCGGGGYDMGPRQFKPLEDYLMAFGVNVMNPHLSHQTLAGARKWDWAQTISDHAPWWDEYGQQATHVGRVLSILTPGREHNRVLVLHPTTTGWLHHRPRSYRRPGERDTAGDRALTELRQSHLRLVDGLVRQQIDFDLGSELVMEELAHVDGNRLHVGERGYELVVLPANMETWTSGTLELMRRYLAAGGQVIALGSPPMRVNGRRSEEPARLAEEFSKQWRQIDAFDDALAAIRSAVPPRVTGADGGSLPAGLLMHRRVLPDGKIALFFANPWPQPLSTVAVVEGESLLALDTPTGQIHAAKTTPGDGRQRVALDLPAFGHALFVVADTADYPPAPPAPSLGESLSLRTPQVAQLDENVLVLDYVDLDVAGQKRSGMATIHADREAFRAHGFDANPWSFGVQFRTNLLDAHVEPDSGFVATYRFAVAEGVDASSLHVAIERPWLYTISVNGREVSFDHAGRWFDEDIRRVAIGEHVRPGGNELALRCQPFHPLAEIQNVYVLGDFALEPREVGFEIVPPRPLTPGDWREQGLPFYPGRIATTYVFELSRETSRLRIELPDWQGSAARIRIDGEPVGTILYPPDVLDVVHPLAAGSHELCVEVVGDLKNQMGPFFNDGHPGPWSWDNSPASAPPGERYRFYATGLLTSPVVHELR